MAPEASDDSESEDEEEVYLGFAVKPSGSLLRNQFRSQLGGLPPWLDPVQLPLTSELTCRASGMPLRFVMQLYAATGTDDPLNFHRSISLFISPQGTLLSRPGAVRAFRCQLPRVNPYYPFEPPVEGAQPRLLTSREEHVAKRRNSRWASRTRAQALGLCAANGAAMAPPLADAALVEVGREARRQAYPELELEVEPEPEDDAEDDPAVKRLLAEYETSQAKPQSKSMAAMAAAEAAEEAAGEALAAAEPAEAATGATEAESAPVSAADAPPSSAAPAAALAQEPGSVKAAAARAAAASAAAATAVVGGEAGGEVGGKAADTEGEADGEADGEAGLKSEGGEGGEGDGADDAPIGSAEAAEEVAALVDAMPGPSAEQQDFAYFTTRMARAPEQCIRYCFDEGAQPLWPSSQGRAPRNIPPCNRCGAPRRFEYQLLPQALHFMQVDSSEPEAPDWATIAVYCCSASCAPRAAVAKAGELREPSSGESEAESLAAVGTRVRFHGLQGRADLNGTTGHVLQWDAQGGRWAVECEDTEENVRVRTANLTALGEGGEGGEGGDGPRGSTALLGGYAEEFVWVQVDDPQPSA